MKVQNLSLFFVTVLTEGSGWKNQALVIASDTRAARRIGVSVCEKRGDIERKEIRFTDVELHNSNIYGESK